MIPPIIQVSYPSAQVLTPLEWALGMRAWLPIGIFASSGFGK